MPTTQSDVSCVSLRSLWVGRGLLLHLPPMVVWDQHRPYDHDWSLYRPTRGQLMSHNSYSINTACHMIGLIAELS